jgi:hypothetical protein
VPAKLHTEERGTRVVTRRNAPRSGGKGPRIAAAAASGLLATLAGLAARYSWHQRRIERSWLTDIAPRLNSIDEVDELSIVPLVERLTSGEQLRGEPGVAYIIRAGNTRLLFDTGLNARGDVQSALVQNADSLGLNVQVLDRPSLSYCHRPSKPTPCASGSLA